MAEKTQPKSNVRLLVAAYIIDSSSGLLRLRSWDFDNVVRLIASFYPDFPFGAPGPDFEPITPETTDSEQEAEEQQHITNWINHKLEEYEENVKKK